MLKKTTICCFLFILPSLVVSQKVLKENLTERERLYWDSEKKHIRSRGAYYTDPIIGDTKEKHGKWWFYDAKGHITEEQNFFRDRIHGQQISFHANKAKATESYFVYNVADSIYREWTEEDTLITEGSYEMGSPNGLWRYFYNNGKLKSKKSISNDTIYLIDHFLNDSSHTQLISNGNGTIKTYYVSGGLKENYTYTNGLKTGPFEERLANGIISINGRFNEGKKDGRWTFYFPNGRIEKCVHYENDELHGSYLVMNNDSSINTTGHYKLGEKHKDWRWFNKAGQLEMSGGFYNGLQDGAWSYYFSSGKLSYKAIYKKGKKHGKWTYYFGDGTLFKEGMYFNDLKDGPWKTNYESGNLLMSGLYKSGKEEGVWTNFWENGKIKNKASFKAGVLNGKWASYSPNERLLLSGNYKKGLKVGEWITYDDKNHILLEEHYKLMKSAKNENEIIVIGRNEEISVLHGSFKAYSETDFAIKAEGNYKKGKKNGTFIDYYPGGVIPTIVAQYKEGKLHGLFQQFTRRGKIKYQIEYKNDLKDGSFIIFDNNGNVHIRKKFFKGRELRN